jgi:hypothetical protein
MSDARKKKVSGRILENIIFLAEIFGDQSTGDIPKVPFIDLARCFEVRNRSPKLRRRRKDWPLWK